MRRLLWAVLIVVATAFLVVDGVGAVLLWLVGAKLWWPALAASIAAAAAW